MEKHISNIVYIIILFALWCFAMWDITKIFNNYLYDNRYTLVTPGDNANETVPPFLEDVQVCVEYWNIFNQMWFNDSEVQDILRSDKPDHLADIVKKLNYSSLDENGYLNLTKREFINAFRYLIEVQQLDDMPASFIDHSLEELEEIIHALDAIDLVKNLELLERTVHNWLLRFDNISDSKLYTHITYMDFDTICTYIKTSKAQFDGKYDGGRKSRFKSPVGLISKDYDTLDIAIKNTEIHKVTLKFPNIDISTYWEIPKFDGYSIQVEILESAIYDISQVSDTCISGDQNVILSLTNEACQYQRYEYVKAIQKICKCTPFTYRNYFINQNPMKYCTMDNYNSTTCMQELHDYMINMTCPRPCRKIKNKYQISVIADHAKSVQDLNGISRGEIVFKVENKNYILYEEKIKLSFSQLIAQIGGDIGMYTGFCLLALWQFFMFLYDHRKKTSGKSNGKPPRDSWYTATMCYLETRGCKYNENESKALQGFESRLVSLQKMQLQMAENESMSQQELRNKMLNLEKEVHDQKSNLQNMQLQLADCIDTLKLIREEIAELGA